MVSLIFRYHLSTGRNTVSGTVDRRELQGHRAWNDPGSRISHPHSESRISTWFHAITCMRAKLAGKLWRVAPVEEAGTELTGSAEWKRKKCSDGATTLESSAWNRCAAASSRDLICRFFTSVYFCTIVKYFLRRAADRSSKHSTEAS
jgi:hypothetical protein